MESANVHPDAVNAAPTTKFASHLHSAAPPTHNARQHPVPLDSYYQTLPMPRKRTPTTSTPFRQLPKCCPCHRQHPVPFDSNQNAAHATLTYTHISPKCCACHAKLGRQPRARRHPVPLDSYQLLPMPRKRTRTTSSPFRHKGCCPCHTKVHPDAGNAASATKFASHLQSAKRGPQPRARQGEDLKGPSGGKGGKGSQQGHGEKISTGGKDLGEAKGEGLRGKGGKGSQQGKGGKHLREEKGEDLGGKRP